MWHQPIVVHVTVQNSTPEPVRLRLGLGATRNFVVKIVRPDGAVVEPPAVPDLTKSGPYNTGRRTVPAFGHYRHELMLNKWFPFDQPGLYRIAIDLVTKVESETGAAIQAATRGDLTVRVGARDEGVLHRICHELLSRIRATTDVPIQFAAALELAQVGDEVALKSVFLEQLDAYTRRSTCLTSPKNSK